MTESSSSSVKQFFQGFELRSSHRNIRGLVFEYALIAALLGFNPLPSLFSLSLVLLGLLSFKMMRDIGRQWGYPRGQDILAIAGNLFGGLGALIMASLAWGFMIVAAIYFPALRTFALAAGYSTFTWIVGQATHQYYASGKAQETKVLDSKPKAVGLAGTLAGGGGSLQRRQVLLGLVAASSFVTAYQSTVRQAQLKQEQAKLAQLALQSDAYVERYLEQAFTGDTNSAEQIQAIKNSVTLMQPTVPYERNMSRLLIRCNRLGTEQYLTGTIKTEYDGSINALPSYEPSLAGYSQIATLIGPEEATTSRKLEIRPEEGDSAILQPDPLRENLNQVEDVVKRIGGHSITLKWLNPVYWGFVLQSPENSILSFRGTQQTNEWFQNVLVQQINHSELSQFEFIGKVHAGFSALYSPIAQQVYEAALKLDHSRPLYITGHSLGASLATLAAMDLAIRIPALKDQLRLYTYAGPRVGNVDFAEAHSQLIPNHYRVVNIADGIPMAPPTLVRKLVFVHAGQPWSFADYSGDMILGHFVSIYRRAIDAEQEQLLKRRT